MLTSDVNPGQTLCFSHVTLPFKQLAPVAQW